MAQKKVLVTAALPYVNNLPHLGTLLPILSADVYARFQKALGNEVLWVCGTDEHGTATETKALEEGVSPKEICDKYFSEHKEVYDWFNCSFDCFGRSSSAANKTITLDIFKKLDEQKYITTDILEQTFCPHDKKFLADRYVEGTCPHCKYEDARGDQCESCGKLLDPIELFNPRCKICGNTPIVKQTKHLFIDLPRLEPELREWLEDVKDNWTVNAQTMTDAWLKEGLKPRCITRDLKWGIPVPKEGYEGKVFYSWFDAPIAYIGIVKECGLDWKSWWKNPEETKLVQFMGKDNIPFHTILFPSFLIGTQDQWTLLHDLSVNEFLNYEGGQFSKSRGIGVFGNDAKESGVPSDIWRYYILVNRPEKGDTEFTWDDFQAKINNELVATLGNLVFRTMSFLNKYLDSVIDKVDINEHDEEFIAEIEEHETKVRVLLEEIKIKDALREIMLIARKGNQYFQEQEPWTTIKTHPVRASTVLGILANMVKDLGILIEPFLPDTAEKIFQQLNISKHTWNDLGLKVLKEGHLINKAELLFAKLEDEDKEKLRIEHSGKKTFPLHLKVGKVLSVEVHEEADKLYILKVDVGEKEPRTIVAGMRPHYSPKELTDKHIIIVSNLAHRKLKGIVSQGMLLAAENNGEVKVLSAPGSPPGSQVKVGELEINEETIEYDAFAKISLTTKQNQVYLDKTRLETDKGEPIFVYIGDGANIR